MEAEQGEFRGSLGHFVCISVPAGSLHLVVSITEGTGTQISLLRGISGAVGEEEPAQLTAQGLSVPPRGRERETFPGENGPRGVRVMFRRRSGLSQHQELWQNTLFVLIWGIVVSLSGSLSYHLCFS